MSSIISVERRAPVKGYPILNHEFLPTRINHLDIIDGLGIDIELGE